MFVRVLTMYVSLNSWRPIYNLIIAVCSFSIDLDILKSIKSSFKDELNASGLSNEYSTMGAKTT